MVGPWALRLVHDLGAERAERVRTQERADMAAHLHDSVLQTLALIQKNSGDAAMVARLARSQERDLRAWLFESVGTDVTLAGELRAHAAIVEDTYGVVVDVVAVGDLDMTEALKPITDATREALTNAAKHAGVPRIDVYAEVSADAVDVFVRDRGAGFDPSAVAEDRQGVRGSIIDRMARHGGQRRGPLRPGRRHRSAAPPAAEERGEVMTDPAPGPTPRPVRVVIVDDHAMFRAGVRCRAHRGRCRRGRHRGRGRRRRLGGRRDPRAPAPRRAPRRAPPRRRWRRGHATDALPDARYLALSVSDAAEDVIGTIRGGARGYVTKTITGPELVDAIGRVADGDAVFSPRLAGFVLDAFAGSIDVAAVDEDLDRLTEREREVMRLIARGYAYKEVAKELFISVKTVETHMSSTLRKLQLSSRHELTRWASDRRLL